MHILKGINIFGDGLYNPIRKIPYIYFILTIGVFLRLYHLAHYDLWFDERATLVTAAFFNSPLYGLVEKFKFFHLEDGHSLLFSLFLSIWIKFAGISLFKLRLLPAIFSALTIYGVYMLSLLFYPNEKRIAYLASFLTAISPIQIWYAQEVRAYSLCVFLVIIFTIVTFRLRDKNNIFLFIMTILSGVGVFLSQYIHGAIFVPLILIAVSFNSHNKKVFYKALGAILILFVFWIIVFIPPGRYWDAFIKFPWIRNLSYSLPVLQFLEFNFGYSGQKLHSIFLIIFFLFIISVVISISKRKRIGDIERFLFTMSFVPIIFLFIFSLAVFDVDISRFILASSIFYYILLAVCLKRTGIAGNIFTIILSFLMIFSCVQYYNGEGYHYNAPYCHRGAPPKTHALKNAFRYLDENISEGDIFAFASWSLGHAFGCYSHHTVINSTYKIYNLLNNPYDRGRGVYHFFLKTSLKEYEYFDNVPPELEKRMVDVSRGDLWKYKFDNLWLFVSQWYYNHEEENMREVIKWCDLHLNLVRIVKFPPFEIRRYISFEDK